MTDDPSSTPADDPEALAGRILNVRFTTVHLRKGYDERATDQLLDSLASAVRAGQDLAPLVAAARLPITRGRAGYDPAEVDAFLDELAPTWSTEIQASGADGATSRPATWGAGPAGSAGTAGTTGTTGTTGSAGAGAAGAAGTAGWAGIAGSITEPQGPGIIPKRRGFLARFFGRQ